MTQEPAALSWLPWRGELQHGWTPDNIRKHPSPTTVIAVGAATGTWPLYQAFPDAHHRAIQKVTAAALLVSAEESD